ncbi:MAG: 4-hydroxy-tetrahydrodipicolinate reductase [Spirochaetia bacterium]
MDIMLVGYGRMGREIEQILATRGHTLHARVDNQNSQADVTSLESVSGSPDCAIEFASPEGVVDNARWYTDHGVAAVVGTTGWDAERSRVRSMVEAGDGSYLWGANFSVGANLFFALVKAAGALIDRFEDYDPMLLETHHRGKKDSPSGTALEAARRLLSVSSRKSEIVTEALQRQIEPHELHVASMRGGSVPGVHELSFDSPFDTITVSHKARTRSGFALGAVLAAEWLSGRTGFFSIDDFFADQLNS